MLNHVKSNKIDQNRSNQPQKWRDPSSNWFLLGAYFIWSLQGMCREVQARGRHPGKTGPSETAVFWRCEDHETPTGFWCMLIWLVIWNMLEHEFLWLSISIGNVIIPTDELHHFSEGLKPPTSNYYYWYYNHYYWWLSHYWCIAVFFWISMFNSSTTRTMNPRSDGFRSGFRSRKPGGCSGYLEIYFQVYWCVLMCIVVYCLFGNGDFVIICDLACDVIPIWEILWNGLKCLNVWICLDDWHIWDRV